MSQEPDSRTGLDPFGRAVPLRTDGSNHYYLDHPTTGEIVGKVRVAGAMGCEILPCIQIDMPAEMPAEGDEAVQGARVVPELVVGLSIGRSFGEMSVDFGEGGRRIPIQDRGLYVNLPNAVTDQRTEVRGRAHIVLVSTPMAAVAKTLGMDPADIAEAIRPLHDDLTDDPLVEALMHAIWRAARRPRAESDLFVDQSLSTLAMQLLHLARGDDFDVRRFEDGDAALPAERLRGDAPALGDRRIARVVDYIEGNLASGLSLADLADIAGTSGSTLSRAFRAEMGDSVWSYVLGRRIEAARRLLVDTDVPLASIAVDCGFADQSHLTNAFARTHGVPPARYREAVRGAPRLYLTR